MGLRKLKKLYEVPNRSLMEHFPSHGCDCDGVIIVVRESVCVCGRGTKCVVQWEVSWERGWLHHTC